MNQNEGLRMSVPCAAGRGEAFAELSRMRGEFYACLTARGDELFELTDAMLCAPGAVRSIPELTLTPEHRRGHGALYDGLNAGRVDVGRLRNLLSRTRLPRFPGGRLVLAVDVSAWLRSDAACSPDRLFCHVYGRAKSASQFIPGWPYSFVAVLEPGASSWTQILDAVRLGPEDDATAVTAAQLRQAVQRLITAGQWRGGDPDILIVADAGYDVCRLGWVLADLPVELVGRLRSDRVMQLPKPARVPGTNASPAQTRATVPLRRPRVLAGAQGHNDHHDRQLWQGHRPGMGSGPPQADSSFGLARPRRRAPGHRGHPDPPPGRAPVPRPHRAAGLAVVLENRRRQR
ncbi:transposase [Nocardia jiangxiensis]|uniref:Transposase n=1 Tax=Nocardia jiangxiensis TaxID=282685 RepID=A0ABW6SBZ9_9NOCA